MFEDSQIEFVQFKPAWWRVLGGGDVHRELFFAKALPNDLVLD
jgi:hypothetical protein